MATKTNVQRLQKAGIIAVKHNLTEADQAKVNGLTESEVSALISARQKLGDALIKKSAKGGKFPHPDSFSY
jgi:hypothetical protein